jgi:hypothetical protein
MNKIKFALPALIATMILASCGGNNNEPNTGTSDVPAVTEEQVTDSFEAWRFKRASKLGDNQTSISVDVKSCSIDSPGNATCLETVTIIGTLYGNRVKQNFIWDITYDEESGDLITAEEKAHASNSGSDSVGSDV